MFTPVPVTYTAPIGTTKLIWGRGEPIAAAPFAEFIGTPVSGTAPLAVTFTDQSSGVYSAVLWDFGDGTTSASANPTHVYSAAGTYTVTLSLTWSSGTVTRTRTAYVGVSAPVVVTPPAELLSSYRNSQDRLFQGVTQDVRPSSIGGGGFSAKSFWLPTAEYVDYTAGWPWANQGGDWIDSNGTPQGGTAHASFAVNAVSGSSSVHRYVGMNVTAAFQAVRQQNKPAAFILRSSGGARSIAGIFGSQQGPVVRVTYVGGTTATLPCRVLARSTGGSTVPTVTGDILALPCFVEFDRPTADVTAAEMDITVTQHWSGSANIGLFILNPPINSDPETGADGLAATTGALDEGIHGIPGILGAQRYIDGAPETDFMVPGTANFYREDNYSPELWGGAVDTTKWPYTVAGKWINKDDSVVPPALVTSGFVGDGFEPLAPGLGAIKVTLPDGGIATGGDTGYAGTGGSNMLMFLPADKMGLTDRIFVRFYVRLGVPTKPTPADRREYRQDANIVWADLAGKWGLTPGHPYYYGGGGWNSGGSGGPYGWQMRLAERVCDEDNGGPSEGGSTIGWHLYDFKNNPDAYDHGSESQTRNNWGQRGGLGSTLYAGRWYCVELEVKLNSVDTAHPTDTGKFYTADGELRAWLNGRMVYERGGMVFRTLPRWEPPLVPSQLRPHRDLGVSCLWWNWFHGGVTKNSYARTMFVTGLAYGEQRIGPMKMPVPAFAGGDELGTVPTQANSWQWTPGRNADGDVTQASVNALPANTWVWVAGSQLDTLTAALTAQTGFPFSRYDVSGDGIRGTFDAWVGCCTDGANVYYPRGGGHADNSSNGVWTWNCLTMRWEIEKAPSDPYDATFPWSSRYRKGPSPDTATYTKYIDEAGTVVDSDGIYWDRLPDGTPTSTHTYNGVWYDSIRRQIGTSRISKWVYDIESKQWTRNRWVIQGSTQEAAIYHDLHYHAGTDTVYGPMNRNDLDNFQFRKFAANSSVVQDISGPPGWQVRGTTGCRLDEDRVWFSYQSEGERAAILNMSTGVWQHLGVISGGKVITGYDTSVAAIFIPTWGAEGQIIRRGGDTGAVNNQWWLYDLATNTNLPYAPLGSAPPSGAIRPGNKYLRIPNLGLAFAIDEARARPTSTPVIYVMRYE